MTHGLYAEYDAIRIWGRYSASPQYAPCPEGSGGGGAGTLVSAEFKTSSIPSLADSGVGLYDSVFYWSSSISYFDP